MNKQQLKKLINLKPKDIGYGSYMGGFTFRVFSITDPDILDKAIILQDILFDEYHLDAQVPDPDDRGYFAVDINERYKTSDELKDILIHAIKKVFEQQ